MLSENNSIVLVVYLRDMARFYSVMGYCIMPDGYESWYRSLDDNDRKAVIRRARELGMVNKHMQAAARTSSYQFYDAIWSQLKAIDRYSILGNIAESKEYQYLISLATDYPTTNKDSIIHFANNNLKNALASR